MHQMKSLQGEKIFNFPLSMSRHISDLFASINSFLFTRIARFDDFRCVHAIVRSRVILIRLIVTTCLSVVFGNEVVCHFKAQILFNLCKPKSPIQFFILNLNLNKISAHVFSVHDMWIELFFNSTIDLFSSKNKIIFSNFMTRIT